MFNFINRPNPFHFAIVDEVDSVLIDEGRNPLLISGEVILDCLLVVIYLKIEKLYGSNFWVNSLVSLGGKLKIIEVSC